VRIISKFRDYYDNVGVGYDTDPKRVYMRKPKELDSDDFKNLIGILQKMPSFLVDRTYSEPTGLIAFCGKAYPYYYFSNGRPSLESESREKALIHCYSFETVLKFWKEQAAEDKAKNWVNTEAQSAVKALTDPEEDRYGGYVFKSSLREDTWERFTQETSFDVSDDVFRRADSPIIHIYRTSGKGYHFEAFSNPRLNEMQFASVVDPYTAYQELEMFLGTNLVNQMDPDVHVPDVVKAESHGFNKFSFRKDPSKKGKRRKARR